jgi:hypothetical protein
MNEPFQTSDLDNALLCGDAEVVTLHWMSDAPVTTVASVASSAPPKLRLCSSPGAMAKVKSAKRVWLDFFMANVYDTSVSAGATGALADVQASLALPNDAFVQTRFKGAAMFDYQPNYFNPMFLVNGPDILQSNPGEPYGLPIPFQVRYRRPLGKVSSMEVYGRAAQEVNGEFIIYPAFAFAILIVMFK